MAPNVPLHFLTFCFFLSPGKTKISMLRSANTHARQFRSVLKEVTYHLGYEATASLKTREVQVSVSGK